MTVLIVDTNSLKDKISISNEFLNEFIKKLKSWRGRIKVRIPYEVLEETHIIHRRIGEKTGIRVTLALDKCLARRLRRELYGILLDPEEPCNPSSALAEIISSVEEDKRKRCRGGGFDPADWYIMCFAERHGSSEDTIVMTTDSNIQQVLRLACDRCLIKRLCFCTLEDLLEAHTG